MYSSNPELGVYSPSKYADVDEGDQQRSNKGKNNGDKKEIRDSRDTEVGERRNRR
jgi:hypothetical protein